MKISLCMIVKNEEDTLGRCLESIKNAVDEIIIVDTGSSDRTKEIANIYTDKVYDFIWCDDFSKARNFAFSKATMDYYMWLDADDIVTKENFEKIKELKEKNNGADVYMLKYAIDFDENNNTTFWYYRERIIKKCKEAFWEGKVHEAIVPFGNIEYMDITIEHRKINLQYSDRNLKIYENMEKNRENFNPREMYYYGRELFYHSRYKDAINLLKKFVKQKDGWIENKIDAYKIIAFSYKNMGNNSKYFKNMIKANSIDTPRADVCCHIASYFMDKNNFIQSIFWYKNALNCEKDYDKGGFIQPDYYDYIPYIQLCVCLDKIGKVEEAFEYNKKAGEVKSNSNAVKFNNEYFNNKLKRGSK